MSTPQPTTHTSSASAAAIAVVYSGERVSVLRNDDTTEEVFVRKLPLRHAQRYLELSVSGLDQEIVQLCLGESPEWGEKYRGQNSADRFTTEAQQALLELCHKLNFTTGEAWIARNKDNRAKLRPLLLALHSFQAELMSEAMEKMTATLMGLMDQGMQKIIRSLDSSGAAASPSGSTPTPSSTG